MAAGLVTSVVHLSLVPASSPSRVFSRHPVLRGSASSLAPQPLSPRPDHGRAFLYLSGNFLLLVSRGGGGSGG